MKKKTLGSKLKNKIYTGLTVASLGAVTLFYGCDKILGSGGSDPDPVKPVAEFVAEPMEGYMPLEVSFNADKSYDLDGSIEKYIWEFGNGIVDPLSGPSVKYTYKNQGEYEPSLTVVDNEGQRSKKKTLEEKISVKSTASLPKIAFSHWDVITEDDWDLHIYVGSLMEAEDQDRLVDLKRLTDTDSIQDLSPAWSPNGKELLFTSNRTGGTAVWRMNSNGGNQRDITSHLVERARQPDWCSNGLIAVSYRNKGDSEAGIGIIDPDEDSFSPIYSEQRTSRIPGSPSWSPDCSEIAFKKYDNGNWEIYTMSSDGTNQKNITNSPDYDVSPDWSPDGSKIAFISDPNPYDEFYELEIYLINPDGNNKTRLTNDNYKDLDPDWSPDGSKLVFARRESPATTQDIWTIDVNKKIESKVVDIGNHERYPVWQPRQ